MLTASTRDISRILNKARMHDPFGISGILAFVHDNFTKTAKNGAFFNGFTKFIEAIAISQGRL